MTDMESTEGKKGPKQDTKDAPQKPSIIQKIDREAMVPQSLTQVDGNEPRRSRKPRKEEPSVQVINYPAWMECAARYAQLLPDRPIVLVTAEMYMYVQRGMEECSKGFMPIDNK